MKKAENNGLHLQPGAGHLLGSIITIVSAITLFCVSENIVVALSASIPIGITMGILFEQKFHSHQKYSETFGRRTLTISIIIGIMLFTILLVLLKFV